MITKDDLKCVLFPKFDYSDVVNIDYDIYGHRPVGDGDVMTYDKNDGEYYGREDR